MNTAVSEPVISNDRSDGPLSRRRQRRLRVLYSFLLVVGVLPWLAGLSPFWRTIGLGLFFPGAGFLAIGGWAVVLLPIALALFAVALFAWFAAAMVVAPVAVWVGAALLAGAMAGPEYTWAPAPWIATAAILAWQIRSTIKDRHLLAANIKKRDARNLYLPNAMIEVTERAAPHPLADDHELSADDVALSRLIFDRSLQPIGQLQGFNKVDQFQTSALRYQLNFLGYGLGMMQSQYAPNFHGYLSEAQRRLIDQYLQRPIWDYWRLENLWGKFKYDPNPVGIDNIMLTAYLGEQVGLYMLNTGDMRYASPGSLTFRWNSRTAYEHDIYSINNSLIANFRNSKFCLFPCEPNWIYTGCNFFGLRSLAVFDRLFGTRHLQDVKQPYLENFDREFTTASGSVISLRSTLTGFKAPFPGGDAGAVQGMNLISPERARRFWAMARNDMGVLIREEGGLRKMKIPGKGLDFGNYGRGFTMIYSGLLMQAREIGDTEFSEALLNALDADCGRKIENGVLSYDASNLANATAFLARLTQRDGRRECLISGPPPEARKGPLLSQASYPEVLVAKARSHGQDLSLVLYPGLVPGRQSIKIERLAPGRVYTMKGPVNTTFTADSRGEAELSVALEGRTSLQIDPFG